MKGFGEDYPKSQKFLLYRGKERLLRDDVLCVPCDEFLLALQPGKEIGS
ncbi:MAG: hypothetical protein M0Q93_09845 [Terrimicrobiaceae bacterium]|nr:hypothetical protein [Terrimicrobiaceae bacterium]